MAQKVETKKTYVKPEVRQIKLSLAEVTLGTNCDTLSPSNAAGLCTGATPQCAV